MSGMIHGLLEWCLYILALDFPRTVGGNHRCCPSISCSIEIPHYALSTWLSHARQPWWGVLAGAGLFGCLFSRNNVRNERTSQDNDAPCIGSGAFI